MTNKLTNGASSMVLPDGGGNWDVFTKINYKGANETLVAGRKYKDLTSIGLNSPVMSMRKTTE